MHLDFAPKLGGFRKSPPDTRDYPARAFLPRAAGPLPERYSLPFQAPVRDQGNSSMCVDYSLVTLKELQEWIERGYHESYGHGYIYGNRAPEHWQDEGMYPREALSQLVKHGVPPAGTFDVTGTYQQCRAAYLVAQEQADKTARPQRIASYVRCTSPQEVMGALYHLKSPVLIGITATTQFVYFTPVDGRVIMQPREAFLETSAAYLGGHAMVVTGYRTIDGHLWYEVQNSWGTGWGDRGRCYIRSDWPGIDEFWTVTDVRPQGPALRFAIDSPTAELINGDQVETMTMDQPATILNNRTMVPLRAFTNAVAKLLGRPIMVLPVIDAAGNVTNVELVLPEEGEVQP